MRLSSLVIGILLLFTASIPARAAIEVWPQLGVQFFGRTIPETASVTRYGGGVRLIADLADDRSLALDLQGLYYLENDLFPSGDAFQEQTFLFRAGPLFRLVRESAFYLGLRVGAQYALLVDSYTVSGQTTNTSPGEVDPYAGVEAILRISGNFGLMGGFLEYYSTHYNLFMPELNVGVVF